MAICHGNLRKLIHLALGVVYLYFDNKGGNVLQLLLIGLYGMLAPLLFLVLLGSKIVPFQGRQKV